MGFDKQNRWAAANEDGLPSPSPQMVTAWEGHPPVKSFRILFVKTHQVFHAVFYVGLILCCPAPMDVLAYQADSVNRSTGRGEDNQRYVSAFVTTEAQQAIDRGLRWLADKQRDDGSFGSGGYARHVAVSSLAGMAFLSAGSTPQRGPYGAEVSRCLQFALENSHDNGLIGLPGSDSRGPMYGHGFATLFLSECYGMSPNRDAKLRMRLSQAVKLIISTQNDQGGWRYQPTRDEADLSVTVCQIMALRAARNAGIFVPKQTIDRCLAYVKQCQNADGGFMYMLPAGPSGFARSAAGVVALHCAGEYEGPEVESGLAYLLRFLPNSERASLDRDAHYLYGEYYAVQAMWHAGGKQWKQWYPAIRDELLARQRSDDGAWMDSICQEYGTAMACIILQMPNNYLPIFQR